MWSSCCSLAFKENMHFFQPAPVVFGFYSWESPNARFPPRNKALFPGKGGIGEVPPYNSDELIQTYPNNPMDGKTVYLLIRRWRWFILHHSQVGFSTRLHTLPKQMPCFAYIGTHGSYAWMVDLYSGIWLNGCWNGSPKRWDRWHIIPQLAGKIPLLWQYIPLIYHL